MSSILKALKRLEEEKAAREAAAAGIAGRVKSGVVVPRPPSPWRFPLALGAVAAAAVLVTYAAMGGFGPGHAPATRPSVTPQEPPQVISPAASLIPSAPTKLTTPVSSPPSSVKPAPPPASVAPVRAGRTTPAQVTHTVAAKDNGAAATETPHPDLQTSPVAAPVESSVPSGLGLPSLKVSGIAWQKDVAGRMAMVNGAAVIGGGKVSGARVEDILPDRVRFSFEGKSFDVFLGRSSTDR